MPQKAPLRQDIENVIAIDQRGHDENGRAGVSRSRNRAASSFPRATAPAARPRGGGRGAGDRLRDRRDTVSARRAISRSSAAATLSDPNASISAGERPRTARPPRSTAATRSSRSAMRRASSATGSSRSPDAPAAGAAPAGGPDCRACAPAACHAALEVADGAAAGPIVAAAPPRRDRREAPRDNPPTASRSGGRGLQRRSSDPI